MRAILEGPHKVEQLAEIFNDLVINLEENGVEFITSVNLYFTPIKNGQRMHFLDEFGGDVDILRFEEPLPIQFVPLHDGVQLESKVDSSTSGMKPGTYDLKTRTFGRGGSSD